MLDFLLKFPDLLHSAIVFGTVIMFGALGEIITEKSGNLNLGVPGIMYFGGIAGIPAQTAAVLSYIDPITAILLSVVLLREDMSAVSAIGCVLVIGAMLVSEIEPKKKRIPAAEQ